MLILLLTGEMGICIRWFCNLGRSKNKSSLVLSTKLQDIYNETEDSHKMPTLHTLLCFAMVRLINMFEDTSIPNNEYHKCCLKYSRRTEQALFNIHIFSKKSLERAARSNRRHIA